MNQTRTIKKYPNRRLYDTAISSYITLSDIRQLVMDDVDFQVVDAKSGDDLTRSILLQIINEQEECGEPIFSSEMLSQFIRFYGNEAQSLFKGFLEQSINLFMQQQVTMDKQMRGVMGTDPVSALGKITEQNMEMWKSVQDNFFKSAQSWNPTAEADKDPDESDK